MFAAQLYNPVSARRKDTGPVLISSPSSPKSNRYQNQNHESHPISPSGLLTFLTCLDSDILKAGWSSPDSHPHFSHRPLQNVTFQPPLNDAFRWRAHLDLLSPPFATRDMYRQRVRHHESRHFSCRGSQRDGTSHLEYCVSMLDVFQDCPSVYFSKCSRLRCACV